MARAHCLVLVQSRGTPRHDIAHRVFCLIVHVIAAGEEGIGPFRSLRCLHAGRTAGGLLSLTSFEGLIFPSFLPPLSSSTSTCTGRRTRPAEGVDVAWLVPFRVQPLPTYGRLVVASGRY